jgi:acyl carrier protein
VDDLIRAALEVHARLSVDAADVGEDQDLYSVGLTSHASVTVMLALEDAFGVEFPDSLLNRQTFSSVSRIRAALAELGAGEDAGLR